MSQNTPSVPTPETARFAITQSGIDKIASHTGETPEQVREAVQREGFAVPSTDLTSALIKELHREGYVARTGSTRGGQHFLNVFGDRSAYPIATVWAPREFAEVWIWGAAYQHEVPQTPELTAQELAEKIVASLS